MGKGKVGKSLKIFNSRVKKAFNPEKVLLFGSYASGKAGDYSDVDVLVVSKKFASVPSEDRLDILYELTSDLYPDFHVFGLTPEEFENASMLTTIGEAKVNGVAI